MKETGSLQLPDFNSPSKLKELLETNNFAMQKRYGQNFLVNGGVREKIIALADLKSGEVAWEIGPGVGSMTALALEHGAVLRAFEIDRGFIGILGEIFSGVGVDRLEIIHGDILKTWRGECERRGVPGRVFGNLPYNIAATIIADFIEADILPGRMVFTLQKEVAKRMTAKPGTADYSSFTALCASAYTVKYEFEIKRGSFWPVPGVDSAVVSMVRRDPPLAVADRALFLALVRGLFASRRKIIRNNLRGMVALKHLDDAAIDRGLAAAGIDPGIRGETLSVDSIVVLADALAGVR
jgi:16S rRNA (adenine1518-N6/adenine1519-N6)-dimethyltransferase